MSALHKLFLNFTLQISVYDGLGAINRMDKKMAAPPAPNRTLANDATVYLYIMHLLGSGAEENEDETNHHYQQTCSCPVKGFGEGYINRFFFMEAL
jgi:hypothetical protein